MDPVKHMWLFSLFSYHMWYHFSYLWLEIQFKNDGGKKNKKKSEHGTEAHIQQVVPEVGPYHKVHNLATITKALVYRN